MSVQASEGCLAIAATFTAEPLAEPLSFWLRELGDQRSVQFAPYNQVFQQLLDPTGLFASNTGGLNVALIRIEDWHTRGTELSAATASLARSVADLKLAFEAARARSATPHVVILCPASASLGALAPLVAAAEEDLERALRAVPGLLVVPARELAAAYPVEHPHSAHGEELGHIPYTSEFFCALATLVARKLHALRAARVKVIALDCDQTLWKGVCAEDGPAKVVVDPARRALQEFMLAQLEAGVLLCLCSKNEDADVVEVLTKHPQMLLRPQHIVARRVNWRPKSENIKSLAEELGFGLDAFVFVDDNPLECAEVEANCPAVRTIALPVNPADFQRFLANVWAFDHLTVTEEDRKRTRLYAQNIERERERRESASLGDFLANLELKIDISVAKPAQLARVAQLTERTTQFNTTGVRRSEADLLQLLKSPQALCQVVEVKDRFGDYGLVGAMVGTLGPAGLTVENFLLSCRALGRGVEHRMLAWLGKEARSRGAALVLLPFEPTARNRPAADFLESLGQGLRASGAGPYRLASERAEATVHVPEREGPAVREAEPSAPAQSSTLWRTQSAILQQIAAELGDVKAVLARVKAAAMAPRPQTTGSYVAPRSNVERAMTRTWADLFGIERVGVEDDFFDLGGHSLLAAQLISRLRDDFEVMLPLDSLLEAPTVAQLASLILRTNPDKQRDIEQAALSIASRPSEAAG